MEEIDTDAWFAGKKKQKWVPKAVRAFESASRRYATAAGSCAQFQKWFPKERREEVTPDIDHFKEMQRSAANIAGLLRKGELPTLKQMHDAAGAMRTAQVAAERKAIALRGTTGHFPAGHP